MEILEDFSRDQRFIKRVVYFEFLIISVIILLGGCIYGDESGRWGQAVLFSGVLLMATAVTMVLVYMRAEQRLKTFSR